LHDLVKGIKGRISLFNLPAKEEETYIANPLKELIG
jgi:hypothetical protein